MQLSFVNTDGVKCQSEKNKSPSHSSALGNTSSGAGMPMSGISPIPVPPLLPAGSSRVA